MIKVMLLSILTATAACANTINFKVDASGHVGNAGTLRLVDDVYINAGFQDHPHLEQDWAIDRFEDTLTYSADWFALSNPDENYIVDEKGDYFFKPSPATEDLLDKLAFRAGLTPYVVMASNTMPGPLIEGGKTLGTYGYNVRQPKDYEKWRVYLESIFQWLVDTYGREEVKTWTFVFGIEADWQTICVKPGTEEKMDREANRREFIKMLDYFHAAATSKLGPTVYVGCYWALETQADDYIDHWATGTNYATGEKGTRIGFCGFSDWYSWNHDSLDPFDMSSKNRRNPENWQAVGLPGMLYKYQFIKSRLDKYPQLAHLDIHLPENGCLYPAGGSYPPHGMFADHRGAALSAFRFFAYAECPNIVSAWNRWSLGSNDVYAWFAHNAKPPIFHLMRIRKRMHGQRRLPIDVSGWTYNATNKIRALASRSSHQGQATVRLLVAQWNDYLESLSEESIRIVIDNLPPDSSVVVREYRIDKDNNNWWQDWRAYREDNEIAYVAKKTFGGHHAPYGPEWQPIVNDVMGTISEEDFPRWLAKAAEYEKQDDLTIIDQFTMQATGGTISFERTLEAHTVCFFELTIPAETIDVAFDSQWQGDDTIEADETARNGKALILTPGEDSTRAFVEVAGLDPDCTYTCAVAAKASGRLIDYRVSLTGATGQPGISVRGDTSADWNNLVVTARPDQTGVLSIALHCPAQECDPEDRVRFRDIQLVKNR